MMQHYIFLKDCAIDSSHSAVTVKEIKCSCGENSKEEEAISCAQTIVCN